MTLSKCQICQSTEHDPSGLCRCGYNFEKDRIGDEDKTKVYYKNLKDTKNWVGALWLTNNVHEFQQTKNSRWSYQNTADLIGEKSKSIISDNINLIRDSEYEPDLLKCDNRTQALLRRKQISGYISSGFKKYSSEKELQKYLETNWEKTPLHEEWELRESHVNAGDAGAIDLLAHHRTENCWLVVELKKDKTPDDTVGQILRYMGWFKENRAGKDEKVQGTIIHGYPPTEHLRYALLYTLGVNQKIYYLSEDETKFMDLDEAYAILKFEKLPYPQQRKKIQEIISRRKLREADAENE